MPENLHITHKGPLATVTMARPEVHNALNGALIAELHAAFDTLATDATCRVIVLTGEGKSFSAGADLEWMRRMSQASEADNRTDAERLAAMLRSIAQCPKPVVARINGAAIAGGTGLAAAADIAIAVENAQFGFAEVFLGIAPATISPYVIAKIGPGRALPLFLTGERFDAKRAHEIGLVHKTTQNLVRLDAAILEIVNSLLLGSPKAQAAIKRMVPRIGALLTAPVPGIGFITEIDEYTSQLMATLRASEEGREGLTSFLEKRKPKWASE